MHSRASKDVVFARIAHAAHLLSKVSRDLESVLLCQHELRAIDEESTVKLVPQEIFEMLLAEPPCEFEQGFGVCYVGFDILDDVKDDIRATLYLGGFLEA